MDPTDRLQELEARAPITQQEALDFFDALPPVDARAILGRWRGSGFATGHRLDGMLATFGWYGKEFVDADTVHPLLFSTRGGDVFKVDPRKVPMAPALKFRVPKGDAMRTAFLVARPLLETNEPRARLRMMEHRGKVSASMIYDDLPVIDIFRAIDEATLLGVMDLRGMPDPLFFLLRRDS